MHIHFFSHASEYLRKLSPEELSVINRQVDALRFDDTAGVHTKQLKGPVRELIAGSHRITYFAIKDSLYFVRGFMKKTRKTPPAEIEYAQKAYKWVKETL